MSDTKEVTVKEESKVAVKATTNTKETVTDTELSKKHKAPAPKKVKDLEQTDLVRFEKVENSAIVEGKEVPLKPFNLNLLESKDGYELHRIRRRIDHLSSFHTHFIHNGVLYIFNKSSKVILTTAENFYRAGDNEITYVDEDFPVIPKIIVYLNESTLKTSSIYGSFGLLGLFNSNVSVNNNLNLENNNTIDEGRINAKSYCSFNRITMKNGSLNGENITVAETMMENSYLSSNGNIRVVSGRGYWCMKGVHISGKIKSIEMTSNSFAMSQNGLIISYYGREEISIISKRRIDNGYFSAVNPIAFVRTEEGILVENEVFDYPTFRDFHAELIRRVRPFNAIETESGGSRGFYFSPATSQQQESFEETYRKVLSMIGNNSPKFSKSQNQSVKFDNTLKIVNEQVLLLSEQINSRLKTFIELDALGA